MSQQKPFDTTAEVLGGVIVALVQCINNEGLIPIMQEHGFKDVQPDQWYPLMKWIDVLNEIGQNPNGMFNLIDAAMKVSMNIPVAESDGTVKGAFLTANQTYLMTHRNGYVGELTVDGVNDREVILSAYSPYPDNYLYGAFYGHARRYCPPGTKPVIFREEPYRYRITW